MPSLMDLDTIEISLVSIYLNFYQQHYAIRVDDILYQTHYNIECEMAMQFKFFQHYVTTFLRRKNHFKEKNKTTTKQFYCDVKKVPVFKWKATPLYNFTSESKLYFT